MARPPALSLSDFEADDQITLRQAAPQAPTLLNWANSHGLRVTSGFSHGGHNSGSKHYQGSETDPGAIDIDHRKVDYNKLLSWAGQNGYTVLDERKHPAGQRAWTAPHYHVQKGGKPVAHKELPSNPVRPPQPLLPVGRTDLSMPVSTDAQGNLVFNQQTPSKVDISKATKPVQQKQTSGSVQLDDFELNGDELAEVKAVAERYKPKPAATKPQPKPQTNFVGDFFSHATNAVAGYSQDDLIRKSGQGVGATLGDFAGGLVPVLGSTFAGAGAGSIVPGVGTAAGGIAGGIAGAGGAGVAQDLQSQRLEGAKNPNWGRAISAGGIQGGLQAIPVLKGGKLLTNLAKNIAVQGVAAGAGDVVQQGFEQGTATPKVDIQRTLRMGALGGAGGAVGAGLEAKTGSKTAKLAGEVELPPSSGAMVKNYKTPEPVPQPTLPDGYIPRYGFVGHDGQLKSKPSEPSPATLNPALADSPARTKELSDAFAERQRPVDAPQVIDPRNAPVPKELGSVKTEVTPDGVVLATQAGRREIPQVEIDRGLPQGRSVAYQVKDGFVTDSQGNIDHGHVRLSEGEMKAQPQYGEFRDDLPVRIVKGEPNKVDDLNRVIKGHGSEHLGEGITPKEAESKRTKLEEAGYTSYNELVDYVSKNYSQVIEQAPDPATGRPVSYLLVAPERNTSLEVVRFISDKGGDYYGVTTAFVDGTSKKPITNYPDRKGTLIWSRTQPSQLIEPSTPPTTPSRLGSDNDGYVGTGGKPKVPDASVTYPKNDFNPQILDAKGSPIGKPPNVRELEIPGRPKPVNTPLEVSRRFEPTVRELETPGKPKVDNSTSEIPRNLDAEAQRAVETPSNQADGNVFRTPEGGEVYTHGRDVADVQRQLEGVKGQVAAIADIERHLQTHNPEAVPAIRNILDAGKNSEAVKFSYVAREAPGEAARVRESFIPTHFTYETIKPGTQRTFLRNKFGSDEAVISHLKQEILNKGGSVDAGMLQTKGGGAVKPATQVNRLIEALNAQTGGAYLKSPRVHGMNIGETTRSAAGDRGIRLDTIVDSSLTGQKVTPEQLNGLAYNNQIAPTLKALNDLANTGTSPVFKRAVNQIQKGEINRSTMRQLKAALADEKLAAQFCNVLGIKP